MITRSLAADCVTGEAISRQRRHLAGSVALDVDQRGVDFDRLVMDQATAQHGAISRAQLNKLGVGRSRRQRWVASGFLKAVGPLSYAVNGSAETWMRSVWCAHLDLNKRGFIAGRTAARLHGLDGFKSDVVEVLVPRAHRGLVGAWTLRSTAVKLDKGSGQFVEQVRCLNVHRLILESALFGFSREETENAIDSALRLRRISEKKLRTDVLRLHRPGINGSRALIDALIDTGGESQLERRFLKLVRQAGLPRPDLQRVYRDGSRVMARVDAVFPGGHVVELEGHGFHSSRQQRQADERRRNELRRVVTSLTVFTYGHVTYEAEYVVDALNKLGIAGG